MTSTNTEDHFLRADTAGRVRVPVERREALLDEFERSGVSALRFAKLAGVKYPTFYLWVAKRKKAQLSREPGCAPGAAPSPAPSANRSPIRFFEALLPRAAGACAASIDSLVIELPGGARLRADSPAQLRMAAELLRMLSECKGGSQC